MRRLLTLACLLLFPASALATPVCPPPGMSEHEVSGATYSHEAHEGEAVGEDDRHHAGHHDGHSDSPASSAHTAGTPPAEAALDPAAEEGTTQPHDGRLHHADHEGQASDCGALMVCGAGALAPPDFSGVPVPLSVPAFSKIAPALVQISPAPSDPPPPRHT